MNHRTTTTVLGAGALAVALLLSGCAAAAPAGMEGMDHGAPAPGPSASASDSARASADAAFAMGMIAHHQQAVDMADVLLRKTGVAPAVVALAERIKAAQQPEIDLMNRWLDAWGVSGSMAGMDHGGMMSADDMAALERADGPAASALFLQQMIVHHEGALVMAQNELAAGGDQDARALAQRIVTDQTAEIAEMRRMLAAL